MPEETTTAKAHRISQLPPEAAAAALAREINRTRAMEVAALVSLNAKLAAHLERLLDTAVLRALDKKKPDIRMLRMIIRYASTANRRMPGLSKPPATADK
jgi:hypothetical protein